MKPTTEQVRQWARESGFEITVTATIRPYLESVAALAYAAGANAMKERCADLVYANALACADGSMLQIYLGSNAAAIRELGDDALDSLNRAAENNGEEL